jgi:4a-hydroxytetrahydrobiopterin dehydratase
MTLNTQKCVPCHGNLPSLTATEAREYRAEIPNWEIIEYEGQLRLQRVYQFPDFQESIAFTNAVGDAAEAEGHHPALLTEWGKVTVTWWTHAIGGLHKNDFIMAAKTDEIFAQPATN